MTGTTPATLAERSGTGGTTHTQIQDHIGRQLRAVYDDVLNQPVPDRLLELLQQLEKKEGDL